MNHKRVHRLYRKDGLSLRLKSPRRDVSAAGPERQPAAPASNKRSSTDPSTSLGKAFVSDALFGGWRLRALTAVDAFTREALAIDVDQGIEGEQIVVTLTRTSSIRSAQGHPRRQWAGVRFEGV